MACRIHRCGTNHREEPFSSVDHRAHALASVGMGPKVRAQAGCWHFVPLASGRRCLLLVARGDSRKGAALIGYFFGPFEEAEKSTVARVHSLAYSDAVGVRRFMHDGIQDGSWPLVECVQAFDRTAWPNPVFGNPGAGYRSVRDEEAPGHEAAVLVAEPGDEDLPRDGYAGSVFMEKVLDLRPTGDAHRLRVISASSSTPPSVASARVRDDEAVILHFAMPTSAVGRWERQMEVLEEHLTDLVEESGVGEFDGIERGGHERVFFLYGPDTERLWATVEPALRSSKVRLTHALLRAGGPDVTPTRLSVGGG